MAMIPQNCKCENPDCQKLYPYKRNKKYCCVKCRIHANNRDALNHSYSQETKIKCDVPTGTIGAAHELIVCADLLKRGFSVFRAQSPSCSCDLVLLLDKKIYRVEVRTGNISSSGKVSFAFRDADKGRFDILAVVRHNWNIVYRDSELNRIDLDDLKF